MPEFGTYGINFPLNKSRLGYMFDLTDTPEDEIKADLNEKTLNRVSAIPKDIKIKNIAA